jgi:S1-C subfamily serine protease
MAAAGQWGFVVAKDSDDVKPGVRIKEVMPGSAAEKAGLKAGDRLLTLDDRWTDSVADCYAAAALVKPGQSVKVQAERDGKKIEVTVKPSAGL